MSQNTSVSTSPTYTEWDLQLEDYVRGAVSKLQAQYVKDIPRAVASMARLRRGVAAAPGTRADIWDITLAGLPAPLMGRDDEPPSQYEAAAHYAITLHAVHQQSKREGMHRKGGTIGGAVRRLAPRDSPNEEAVLRRFHALGTAGTFDGRLLHLRGLVTQLRGAGIPLDYGRLARDLRRLQQPALESKVRLDWGRDYHRTKADVPGATESESTDPTGESE